jgi:hypothetical protein
MHCNARSNSRPTLAAKRFSSSLRMARDYSEMPRGSPAASPPVLSLACVSDALTYGQLGVGHVRTACMHWVIAVLDGIAASCLACGNESGTLERASASTANDRAPARIESWDERAAELQPQASRDRRGRICERRGLQSNEQANPICPRRAYVSSRFALAELAGCRIQRNGCGRRDCAMDRLCSVRRERTRSEGDR